MNGLKVKSIEVIHSDAVGVDFKKVTFVPNTGANQLTSAKARVRNLWGEREINGVKFAADPMFDDIFVGAEIPDAYVKTFTTTPYKLPGNDETLTKATFVLFADDDPYRYAALQMRDNNAKVHGEDGELVTVRAKNSKPKVTAKPAATATAGTEEKK